MFSFKDVIFNKISKQQLEQLPKNERVAYRKARRTFKRIRALIVLLILLMAIVFGVKGCVSSLAEKKAAREAENQAEETEELPEVDQTIRFTESTVMETMNLETFYSSSAVLINADTMEIVAVKGDYNGKIYPASMTKVLTLLVAAENIDDWSGTTNFDLDTEEYCFVNECSNVGYARGEKMLYSELPYGTILSSGADAALPMAFHAVDPDGTSGKSFEELHSAFADMMNEKVAALGLPGTHFVNCVGIHDENHYTTLYDMAAIMYAAMDNEFCRNVLTTEVFETAPTDDHPSGQVLRNVFMGMVNGMNCGGTEVIAAKTGYVSEAAFCAVSYATAPSGTNYICVTAAANGTRNSAYDHAAIYKNYAK